MKDTQQPTDSSLSKEDKEKIADAVKITRKTAVQANISLEELVAALKLLPKGNPKKIDPRHIC